MKKQFLIKLFALVLVLCTLFLNSCSVITNVIDKINPSDDVVANDGTSDTTDINNGANDTSDNNEDVDHGGGLPDGAYNEGVVLVKYTGDDENVFAGLDIKSAEVLYEGAVWYMLELLDSSKTVEMVQAFADLGIFDYVDYDYIMATDSETESYDISGNPNYEAHQKKHHNTHRVKDGWDYMNNNGKTPGGSTDVIVAVIDTGVDYNHLDLRNNIWTNPAEIPDNGIDDDGNGYIDDVYGWDCVGNDKDPMDDNGHGTHVAGIIAAENNGIGGVGVAYNCKIMVLKAGNSSGYFNNSDIAEAIQYAYMNGASVINMSFGGSNISLAVEDALEEAYSSCILVAAAGNDSACNNLACKTCGIVGVSYPAALPYVIGVMSVNPDGDSISSFSNYDHDPYNDVEYEVYAVGSSVYSCWPDNKYATLNGTSMAAPTVAGIAALLRSYYTDREVYSTKYIQSQIVNTGTINPYNAFTELVDDAHSVVNVYEALTRVPTPEVNLYDYYIDDSTTISKNNNGNGVIDAGETVRLYISLHNRGGVASDVNVTIDTIRSSGYTDPYFTFVNTSMELSDIGTYSVRESGDKYFEIIVASDCPNDYLTDFNIRFTYKNGLNTNDTTAYGCDGVAQFNVSNGYHLASLITEDTVFTADKLYIVGEDVIIPEGVTVTFEEGCQIQFYDDRDYYNSPVITVYGTLNFNGSENNLIKITPSERNSTFACIVENLGNTFLSYVYGVNLVLSNEESDATILVDHSLLKQNVENLVHKSIVLYHSGKINYANSSSLPKFLPNLDRSNSTWSDEFTIQNSYIEHLSSLFSGYNRLKKIDKSYILIDPSQNAYIFNASSENRLSISDSVIVSSNMMSGIYTAEITVRQAYNNYFLAIADKTTDIPSINFKSKSLLDSNAFSEFYQQYASQVIVDYYDSTGNPTVDVYGSLADASLLWPHVVSVEMFNADGEPITVVGKEQITVRVTFNRPMDTTQNTTLSFSTIEPYADYVIEGEYISDTVWEGTYTLKAQIENGQNFLKVNNACAAEDQTKTVFGEYQLHEFTIDTTAALAMNLIATPTESGIELTWAQDDYDTLMGYNIYRSKTNDGNYVKINPSILLDTDSTFLDTNAEPGKTYWYTFTVVLSDFSESNPAGKVSATAIDTIFPNIYHTPVNQGYLSNNLVISCTASDNIEIDTLTLYYRTVGATEWHTLTMSKVNDKYSATVFGSDLALEGLEYYIVATDGRNVISKGDADAPYTVVIKDASAISKLGDVDGDGTVTTKDALMLMQCINGDLILSDDEFKRADLNKDGTLSSTEALRILQYINGKINTLEM